jgi:hypothetical protein
VPTTAPVPQYRIDADELRLLLKEREQLRLEFKLKYELSGPNKGKMLDEVGKDLIALINTAGRHARDYAYLILGAGDELLQMASAGMRRGAVWNVVGIGGAISSDLKLSDQAARSIG